MAPKGNGIAAAILIFIMIAIVVYFLAQGIGGPGGLHPDGVEGK